MKEKNKTFWPAILASGLGATSPAWTFPKSDFLDFIPRALGGVGGTAAEKSGETTLARALSLAIRQQARNSISQQESSWLAQKLFKNLGNEISSAPRATTAKLGLAGVIWAEVAMSIGCDLEIGN